MKTSQRQTIITQKHKENAKNARFYLTLHFQTFVTKSLQDFFDTKVGGIETGIKTYRSRQYYESQGPIVTRHLLIS